MTLSIDVHRSVEVSQSARARQLEAMFDVPAADKISVSWSAEFDLDVTGDDWQIGLIVGPSGSGKSTLLAELFGEPNSHTWSAPSVIDDFDESLSMDEIAAVCQAVGFNTIPSWLKPFAVLSNGERFRVELARSLGGSDQRIVIDEFTSVVDRQVAQIGAHAVAKYIRRHPNRRFVAASCHYDIVEWLQPDWLIEPATMTYTRRSVQPRPSMDVEIYKTTHETWLQFAPFHYMSAELNRAAACFVLCVNDRPVAFCGILHRPISARRAKQNLKGFSRTVTLPDWQGLGLSFVLSDTVAAAYKAIGIRTRKYPAHPAYIRSVDRSPNWAMITRPQYTPINTAETGSTKQAAAFGGRFNAVFEYCGPAMDHNEATALLGNDHTHTHREHT